MRRRTRRVWDVLALGPLTAAAVVVAGPGRVASPGPAGGPCRRSACYHSEHSAAAAAEAVERDRRLSRAGAIDAEGLPD